jgi:putative glutamine amidotransferase
MKKTLVFLWLALVLCMAPAAVAKSWPSPAVPVIVMTHPTLFQVKNIVEMYEKNILPLPKLVLLGIYHEDECAAEDEARSYQDALDYARENRLDWVRFRKITGRVAYGDLFRENAWTAQFREIFALADAIIFTGGMDIPPAMYGQATGLLTEPTTPERSAYEISFLFHLLGGRQDPAFTPFLKSRPGFPILAICLGLQSMNVAAGGSLVQDIPSEAYGLKTVEEVLAADSDQVHSGVYLEKFNPHDDLLTYSFHRIHLADESIFVRRMGFSGADRPHVASAHHQAVKKLGAGLRPTAFSMDGRIIEALEHDRFANILAIQFHPERHTLYRKGYWQRSQTAAPLDFNPLAFLKANPPSYEFHLAIWKWFSEQVLAQKKSVEGGR